MDEACSCCPYCGGMCQSPEGAELLLDDWQSGLIELPLCIVEKIERILDVFAESEC